MEDLSWLATRQLSWQVDSSPAGGERVVVAPIHINHAQRAGAQLIVSVAGYPTGRHHSLVKAAEARLAVQSGASEVWVCVDGQNTDLNAHLAELVAIRDACPPPARLGLIAPHALEGSAVANTASATAASATAASANTAPANTAPDLSALATVAAQAGFERFIIPPQHSPHAWPLEAVALYRGHSLAGTAAPTTEEVVAQLEAGAAYVAS